MVRRYVNIVMFILLYLIKMGWKLKNDSLLLMLRIYDFILEVFLDLNLLFKL